MANWGNPSSPSLKTAIYNGTIPKEGPKTLPIKVDLTVNTSALIDFSQQNIMEQISFIQGVYIDNSGNSASMTLISEGTNQVVEIAAGAQGYYPLLAALPNKFIVATLGGVQIPLFFYNVPMPAVVWGEGVAPFAFDSNGNLKTADQNLAPLINNRDGSNDALDVNVVYGGGSAGVAGLSPVIVTSQGGAGILNLTILNPSASQKFKIAGVAIYADLNIYDDDGNSGLYSWALVEGTSSSVVATLASGQWYIPPVPRVSWGGVNDVGKSIELFRSPSNWYYESSALDNPLTFILPGFAWDAGLIRVHASAQVYTP